ncbi:glycerol-3-phosphate 1-O-acyltransferase PlsY [Pseudacidobacterium ailaaui]|jgi:glycerol-3-phosphate acyltransferase PlsY|uniref:glycerol-3-phosphate 1-O-acyltransferase PlsY n=1 Tax=Pseudacidobacterium ailaaui TaxID=1382359 RepID=UPI0005D297D3|nr:glycerol-3-phosphate 1-O-acyltransferase PlsY [Pseudacidobacterium ailaaui]MCL6464063.1 glycerol-3-phosphate 1-O-acyltransferase PlsY [Pseudacidobacterium ailaaui]MDI3253935.1 glycerol-3-phosphate 1-O-acyltransferase PlsY [Bacillota bacterium]
MLVVPYFVIALIAYLLGSVPFGYVLVRVFRKEDIRAKGSGNIGATNVVRSGAKGLGALTFLLDALKGALAVLLAQWVFPAVPAQNAAALAALSAILGHIFPVWLRFKGGKGVATALGVFLALAWPPAMAGLGVFVLVFVLFRYVSLASILAAAAFPLFAFLLPHRETYNLWLTAVILIVPVLVIAKHSQNIRRLLHGTEYRFGKSKEAAA